MDIKKKYLYGCIIFTFFLSVHFLVQMTGLANYLHSQNLHELYADIFTFFMYTSIVALFMKSKITLPVKIIFMLTWLLFGFLTLISYPKSISYVAYLFLLINLFLPKVSSDFKSKISACASFFGPMLLWTYFLSVICASFLGIQAAWGITVAVVATTLLLFSGMWVGFFFGAFFGAINVWGWHWALAALYAFPFGVLLIAGLTLGLINFAFAKIVTRNPVENLQFLKSNTYINLFKLSVMKDPYKKLLEAKGSRKYIDERNSAADNLSKKLSAEICSREKFRTSVEAIRDFFLDKIVTWGVLNEENIQGNSNKVCRAKIYWSSCCIEYGYALMIAGNQKVNPAFLFSRDWELLKDETMKLLRESAEQWNQELVSLRYPPAVVIDSELLARLDNIQITVSEYFKAVTESNKLPEQILATYFVDRINLIDNSKKEERLSALVDTILLTQFVLETCEKKKAS